MLSNELNLTPIALCYLEEDWVRKGEDQIRTYRNLENFVIFVASFVGVRKHINILEFL